MLPRLVTLCLLALVGTASAHEPVPSPSPVPAPPVPKLEAEARVGLGTGPARKITVTNPTDNTWNQCKVSIKGLFDAAYTYEWPTIPAGEKVRTRSGDFTTAEGINFRSSNEIIRVIIECDEGRTSIWPNEPKR